MAHPPRSRKIFVGIGISLLVLLAVEIGLRVIGFGYRPLDVPMAIWNPEDDKLFDQANNLHLREVRQLWALRPGSEIPDEWAKGEVINAAGFRGPLIEEERTPGTLRVATLGDSSTFGVGMPYAKCYTAQIEEICEAQQIPTEVIDGGVIGFSVRQGLERYREAIRPYRPDVVVAAFGAVNEHHSAPGTRPDAVKIELHAEQDTLFARIGRYFRVHSRLVHLIDMVLRESRGGTNTQLEEWRKRMEIHEDGRKRCGQIEYDGPRRVSLEDFTAALGELADEVERDGARLVLISMPREVGAEYDAPVLALYSAALAKFAADRKLPLYDARADFRARAQSDPDTALFLPGDHWHPSVIGHRVIAEALVPLVTAGRKG